MGKRLSAAGGQTLDDTLRALEELMGWQVRLIRDARRQAKELTTKPPAGAGGKGRRSPDR